MKVELTVKLGHERTDVTIDGYKALVDVIKEAIQKAVHEYNPDSEVL